MGGTIPDSYYFYHYTPSIPLAATFLTMFALLSFYHLYLLMRHRCFIFVPFVLGGLLETVGFGGRILSHNKTHGASALGPYVLQSTCLLVAVVLYSATLYMFLVRLAVSMGSAHDLPVKAGVLAKLFVAADIIAFNIQGLGGGLMAAVSLKNLGERLTLAGVWVQTLFFAAFMVCAALWWRRVGMVQGRERTLVKAATVASVLILVRSIFRLIEYQGGNDGVLMRSEVWLYVFDSALMVVVMVVMAVWYPGVLLGKRNQMWGRVKAEGSEEDGCALKGMPTRG